MRHTRVCAILYNMTDEPIRVPIGLITVVDHTSLGSVKTFYDWDWAGAQKKFARAIELNPSYAPIAIGLGLTLIHLIGIPVTNLSVNPARSTGPALLVGGCR